MMFYMKDENGNFINLDGEFYYQCAGCGKMEEIDLVEMIRQDPDMDIFSTAIYCADCTKKRMQDIR